MDYHLTASTVEITCTFTELISMAASDLVLYAVPYGDGLAMQVYLAENPLGQDDFELAQLKDFEAEAGYDLLAEGKEAPDARFTLVCPRWPVDFS